MRVCVTAKAQWKSTLKNGQMDWWNPIWTGKWPEIGKYINLIQRNLICTGSIFTGAKGLGQATSGLMSVFLAEHQSFVMVVCCSLSPIMSSTRYVLSVSGNKGNDNWETKKDWTKYMYVWWERSCDWSPDIEERSTILLTHPHQDGRKEKWIMI